jgi:hypothetical protein
MGMYFLTVLGETHMPNFTKSSLAMRSSRRVGRRNFTSSRPQIRT